MAYSFAGACNNGIQVYGAGIIMIIGSFAMNGGTTPVAANNKGKGFTVVRTAAGLFTLTFTSSAISVLSAFATCQCVTDNTNLYAQLGAIDVVTALTAVIKTMATGTNTDPPAANANNRVHFGFFMATSSLNS